MRWVRVPYSQNSLPDKPGCYAIFSGKKILYIGSSVNLRTRFRTHQIHGGMINGVAVGCKPEAVTVAYKLSSRYGDWAMIEIRLLRRLRPPVNSHHNGGKRFRDFGGAR